MARSEIVIGLGEESVAFGREELEAAGKVLFALASAIPNETGAPFKNLNYRSSFGQEELDGQKPSRMTWVTPERRPLLEYAAMLLEGRRKRAEYVDSEMFGEAAWDMLLALYTGEGLGIRYAVSSLSNESGVPATTALRWINYLMSKNLIEKRSHKLDRRISHIELAERARQDLDRYFSELTQR